MLRPVLFKQFNFFTFIFVNQVNSIRFSKYKIYHILIIIYTISMGYRANIKRILHSSSIMTHGRSTRTYVALFRPQNKSNLTYSVFRHKISFFVRLFM